MSEVHPSGKAITYENAAEQMTPQDLLEDYLDHLCAPLVAVVPFTVRSRLRKEALFHLEQLQSSYIQEGESEENAAIHAIETYGTSEKVGREFAEQWFVHQPRGWYAKFIGLDNAMAAFYFGQLALWCLILLQIRIFFPSFALYTFGLTLAEIRQIIPEPLPLPDLSLSAVLLFTLTAVGPIVAGWLTGLSAPLNPARAVLHVVVLIAVVITFIAYQTMPSHEALNVGAAVIFWWLPVGCFTAHISAALKWRKRCSYSPAKIAKSKN